MSLAAFQTLPACVFRSEAKKKKKHSDSLCLLSKEFNTFTFKVIINHYVFIAILSQSYCFGISSLILCSFALFFCGLVTFFSIYFRFLSHCLCVSIIDFWFVVVLRSH